MKRHACRCEGRRGTGFRPGRGGWQLIEMVFVITIAGMVSIAAVRLVVGLLATHTRGSETVFTASEMNRLGRLFRHDAHVATAAILTEDSPAVLELSAADGALVRYTVAGDRLDRDVQGGDVPQTQSDSFLVPGGHWQLVVDDEAGILRAICIPQEGGGSAPEAIEAALGLAMRPEEASP